jgi:hypothetical protein
VDSGFYARFIAYTAGRVYTQLLQFQSYCDHTEIFTSWPPIFFCALYPKSLSLSLRASTATNIHLYCLHYFELQLKTVFMLARTTLANFSVVTLSCTVVSMLLLLLYNRHTDHTENIFGSIVETCLQRFCLETVAMLR